MTTNSKVLILLDPSGMYITLLQTILIDMFKHFSGAKNIIRSPNCPFLVKQKCPRFYGAWYNHTAQQDDLAPLLCEHPPVSAMPGCSVAIPQLVSPQTRCCGKSVASWTFPHEIMVVLKLEKDTKRMMLARKTWGIYGDVWTPMLFIAVLAKRIFSIKKSYYGDHQKLPGWTNPADHFEQFWIGPGGLEKLWHGPHSPTGSAALLKL